MASREDLIWAAGFIDGEGCISIGRYKMKSSRYGYKIRLTVGQAHLAPLEELHKLFGGSLGGHANGRNFRWEVTANAASQILSTIRPFLRVKGAEADIALAFQSRRRTSTAAQDHMDFINLSKLNRQH